MKKTSNYLAIKLDGLNGKEARCECHKDLLMHCTNEGIVSKGQELIFEPTIGNNDQLFLVFWTTGILT